MHCHSPATGKLLKHAHVGQSTAALPTEPARVARRAEDEAAATDQAAQMSSAGET